jgi:hypothetical protein
MILNIVIFILSIPIYLLSLLGGLLNVLTPPWFTDTIANTMGGSSWLNSLFPMYPHPAMTGLAAVLGIMPIFGWMVTLMGYLIVLTLGYKLIKMLFGLLPWNTAGADIKTGGH